MKTQLKISYFLLLYTVVCVSTSAQKNTLKNFGKSIEKEIEQTITTSNLRNTPAAAKTNTNNSEIKTAEGIILYVSKQNVNNKNDGSKSSPLKKLDKAIALITLENTINIPKNLKVNKDYLDAYLNAHYSEQTDIDRNSPSNIWRSMMGMNLQGTMTSSATMFGNRYPWKDALYLFDNIKGYGAQ